MAYKLDFDDIRARVSIERVAEWLGIQVNQRNRAECPLCSSAKDNPFTITPAKGMWGCFACGKKGNIFHLVMAMREITDIKDAAQAIHEHFLGTVQSGGRDRNSTADRTVRGTEDERGLKPLDYLDAEHPAIDAVGFDQEFAAKHGIGYAPKGIAKGHVLIPFRDEHGILLGYIGVQDEVWLPKDFKPADTKVVPLKRA